MKGPEPELFFNFEINQDERSENVLNAHGRRVSLENWSSPLEAPDRLCNNV